MSTKINALREQRNTLAVEIRNMLDNNPGKLWTAEHQKVYDAKLVRSVHATVKEINDEIDFDTMDDIEGFIIS